LWLAVLLVAATAAVGLGLALISGNALPPGKLSEALAVASVTLVFGALLGGVVKLLLEDVQRGRESRSEQARFDRAVLDDLKSVYDRVERVKVLIAANRSALTYGEEMRDLIDSAVQLRNVERALDQTSGITEDPLCDVQLAVRSMEVYLNSLIDEFKERYKPIADKQRIYEATFDRQLKETPLNDLKPDPEPPINPAWPDIEHLPRLYEFRLAESADGDSGGYERDFIDALDLATWVLRAELKCLADKSEQIMPKKQIMTRNRLRQASPCPEDHEASPVEASG
jgi:hypothetical protein